jgi:hypothetical protein
MSKKSSNRRGTEMSEAQRIYDMAITSNTSRTPRSDAYKLGVLDALRFRFGGVSLKTRYQLGSAECDAWFSGTDEGHLLWRSHSSDQVKG